LAVILTAHGIEQLGGLRITAREHGQPLLETSRRITWRDLAARLLPEVPQQGQKLLPGHGYDRLASACGGDLPRQVRARNQPTAEHDVVHAADFATAPPILQTPNLAV